MASDADNQQPPGADDAPHARALGRYELLTEIASGGMASVFLGRARGVAGFERVVAVKVCHPHLRSDEEFAGMFLDEARLAAKIHHPNVVSTLDVGDEGGRLFLVMEYIEGDRLSGLIKAAGKRARRVPAGVTARIFIDLLSGLHAAHELTDADGSALSVVHRDVSPQNVLVGVDGVARITDFGIAKAQARITTTGLKKVKGKLSYMAPEQLGEGGSVSCRTDIYAAGVVLWETLTGKRLFRGETDVETVDAVLRRDVPRPSEVSDDVDPAFDAVVMKAIARDPDKRYPTAAAFAEALEDLPIKIANARAVSALVQELQGATLTARRDLVRRIGEGEPLVLAELTNPSAVRFARTDISLSLASSLPPPLPREEPFEAEPEPEPAPPSRRWALLALPALVLLLIAGLALASRRPPEAPRAHAPTRPAAPPEAPPLPAPPPMAEPPVAEAPPPAPPPEAAAEPPAALRPVARPGGRRSPPRRPATAASPTTTETPPAGEFRPGSI